MLIDSKGKIVYPEDKPIIALMLTDRGWMAIFPRDDRVTKLMGTRALPTTFTSSAIPEQVRVNIQALNPDYDVVIAKK